MKMKRTWLAAGALVALSGPAFAQNLLFNGDFEQYAGPAITGSGYYTVSAGPAPSTIIPGWTVGGVSVDVILFPQYSAIGGLYSIDLAGTPGPGTLSQSFNAVAGQAYQLNWDYSSNGGTELLVTFGTLSTANYNVSGLTTAVAGQLNWVASITGLTTVTFSSGASGSNGGPVIDNVSVAAVPEPSTYALALAALALVGGLSRVAKRYEA